MILKDDYNQNCGPSMLTRRSLVASLCAAGFIPSAATAGPAEIDIRHLGARIGEDALPFANVGLALLARHGGGILKFPKTGKPWVLSDTLLIQVPNVTIILEEDIVLRSALPASAFLFKGRSRTQPLRGVSIEGRGITKPRIDGGGRGQPDYKYSTSDTFYSCILFQYCETFSAKNVYCYNGLVNCLRAFASRDGGFFDCDSSHSEYDNGQSIDFDLSDRGDSLRQPPRTILRGRAWNCAGFGITCYAASYVNIIDVIVRHCGNDDPSAPVNGGGLSVEGDYKNSITALVDLNVKIVRPNISNCWNAAVFITARGVHLEGGAISSTLVPLRRDNRMGEQGSAVYAVGAGAIIVHNLQIISPGGTALVAWGSHGNVASIVFNGKIVHAMKGLRKTIGDGTVSFLR